MHEPPHHFAERVIRIVEQRLHDKHLAVDSSRAVQPEEVRRILVSAGKDLSVAAGTGSASSPYRDDAALNVLADEDVTNAIATYFASEGKPPRSFGEHVFERKAGYVVIALGAAMIVWAMAVLVSQPYLGGTVAVFGLLAVVIGVTLMGIGQGDYRPSAALSERRRSRCRTLIASKMRRLER